MTKYLVGIVVEAETEQQAKGKADDMFYFNEYDELIVHSSNKCEGV